MSVPYVVQMSIPSPIYRRRWLDGMLNFYYREAA